MTTHAFTRAVTIFAVGFLVLNAVLLVMLNHFFWATACVVVAALAIVGWFWYRRTMRELADDRKEMKREVESLREFLHTHRRN